MKAIGYARVSSDDQVRKGKGLPDQKKAIEDYCRREGLDLAEILEDDGYSASKGEHLAKGNLGKLLPKVDAGKYKCFALVVDEIDRLSRLDLDETQQLIRRFWKGGLEVHLVMGEPCHSQSQRPHDPNPQSCPRRRCSRLHRQIG